MMTAHGRYTVLGLAAVLITFVFCGKDDPAKPPASAIPSVRGTVTLIGTGAPVPGAAVVLVDPSSVATRSAPTRTDSKGQYEISERVAAGRYALFLYADSTIIFDRSGVYLTVEDGKTTTHDVRMVGSEFWGRSKPFVNGLVVDDSSGAAIPGAYVGVAFWGVQGVDVRGPFVGLTHPEFGITDAAGRFSVTNSMAIDVDGTSSGLLPIGVSKSGYEPTTLVGHGPDISGLGSLLPLPEANSDSILNVTIRLHRLGPGGIGPHGAGSLTGRVWMGSTGVAGVRVAASLILSSNPDTLSGANRCSPVPDKTALTDAQGSFTIAGLAPGSYYLEPAFLPDDGYVHNWTWFVGADSAYTVLPNQTVDAGDYYVARALRPLTPAAGSEVTDSTPAFSWTPMRTGPGYTLLWYRIWFSDRFYERHSGEGLRNSSWVMPDSLALHHGDHIRWFAEAIGTVGAFPDTVVIGEFEQAATFTVR
jgi:hypothetical protein